jgi:ADP-ribose pyrophosphatase
VEKKTDLTESFVSGEEVYRGKLLQVHRDRVRLPDGTETQREYIRHPGAVAMVALTREGRVVLERQFRYPLRCDFIEIPAGKREPGEAPEQTARRELLEETGYAASEWRRLGVLHNAIGYSDESIEIYLARGLQKNTARLEAGEFLEVLEVPFAEALAMARDGRISDVKTLCGLFWVEGVLRPD